MLFELLLLTVLFVLALSPLLLGLFGRNRKKRMHLALIANIVSVFAVCLIVSGFAFTTTALAVGNTAAAAGTASSASGFAFIGAALVTAASCIGGGIAVASAASAALGAISENEGLFGKALIIVVLAEGIAIYGMLISLLILGKV